MDKKEITKLVRLQLSKKDRFELIELRNELKTEIIDCGCFTQSEFRTLVNEAIRHKPSSVFSKSGDFRVTA